MKKGFTLLEIMVALMVLAIGLASIFGLFGTGTQSYRRGVNDATVSHMATTILSELEASMDNSGSRNILPRDVSNKTHPDFSDIYKYDLTLAPIISGDNSAVLATLVIKWKQPKGVGSEKFETIIRTKTADTHR